MRQASDAKTWSMELAAAPADRIAATVRDRMASATLKEQRSLAQAFVEFADDCAQHGRWGRTRAAVVAAVALEPPRLVRIERMAILAAKNPLRESRRALLDLFSRDDLASLQPLGARIATYAALEDAAARFRAQYRAYRLMLRRRQPGFLKFFLCLADTAFADTTGADTITRELREVIDRYPVWFDSPTSLATLVSVLLADAFEDRPYSATEEGAEPWTGAEDEAVGPVLVAAGLRVQFHEWQKKIALIGDPFRAAQASLSN